MKNIIYLPGFIFIAITIYLNIGAKYNAHFSISIGVSVILFVIVTFLTLLASKYKGINISMLIFWSIYILLSIIFGIIFSTTWYEFVVPGILGYILMLIIYIVITKLMIIKYGPQDTWNQ